MHGSGSNVIFATGWLATCLTLPKLRFKYIRFYSTAILYTWQSNYPRLYCTLMVYAISSLHTAQKHSACGVEYGHRDMPVLNGYTQPYQVYKDIQVEPLVILAGKVWLSTHWTVEVLYCLLLDHQRELLYETLPADFICAARHADHLTQ